MKAYQPSSPFSVLMYLLIPQYQKKIGVETKIFPNVSNGIEINGNFKTFGGTERSENGVYSIIDTATIETWYRPDITSDCRIYVPQTESIWEIINEPENINLRNQFLKFKVKRVHGGA